MNKQTLSEWNEDWLARGQPGRRTDFNEALIPHRILSHHTPIPPGLLFWGGVVMPLSDLNGHFFTLGASRVGKSQLMNIEINCVVRAVEAARRAKTRTQLDRAFLIDTKGDAIDLLEGRGVEYILYNPSDSRSWDWDIAKDHATPNSLFDLACAIIPQGRESNPFWTDAARAILAGCFVSLKYSFGDDWNLGDAIILCLFPMDDLIEYLLKCPGNSFLVNRLREIVESDDTKLIANLGITLFANLAKLMPAAANSQRAKRRFTLSAFLNHPEILVIVPDQEALETVLPIFHALMARMTKMLASRPDTNQNRTYIFLDELSFLGRIPHFDQLVTFTASKGVHVHAATQGIGRMRQFYGDKPLNDILDCFGWKTILRTQDPDAALWAASLFGTKGEWVETPNMGEYGYQKQWMQRPQVTNYNIMQELPFASANYGVTGYFLPGSSPSNHHAAPYKATIDAPTISLLNPRLNGQRFARQETKGFNEQLLDETLFLAEHRRVVEAAAPSGDNDWEEKIVQAFREELRPHIQRLFARAFNEEMGEQMEGNY
jgi:hypothetical protein